MYGAQLGQAAPAATQPASPPAAPQTKQQSTTAQAVPAPEPVTTPAEVAPTETKTETPAAVAQTKDNTPTTPVTTPVQVRRIQVITGGNARWSSTLLVLSLCGMGILWTLQRGFEIKRLLRAGEHFFLHNLHIDMTVMAFLVLGATLLQTTGTVR